MAALSAALVACSAASRDPREAEGPEPAAYAVAPGESFEIRLAANPSTGFQWQLGAPLDAAVVREVSSTFVATGDGVVGAKGASVWTFAGVAPGRATIVLVYRRPWEPEVAPARVAVYSVRVGAGEAAAGPGRMRVWNGAKKPARDEPDGGRLETGRRVAIPITAPTRPTA